MTFSRSLSSLLSGIAAGALIVSVPAFARPQTDAAPKEGKATKAKKPARKPQSELAAKGVAFATVAASDPSVARALKATNIDAATKMDGKPGALTGTVTDVFQPHSNSIVILNFAKDFHKAASAVVFSKSFSAFPALASLEGKTVLITGTFKNYQGRPEVVLSAPTQVKIVK